MTSPDRDLCIGPATMTDKPTPANASRKAAMYALLAAPVAVAIVIVAIGTYAQRGRITPRWKKPQPTESTSPAVPTNAPPPDARPE